MREEYIIAAKEACAYVYKICPLGSANRCNGIGPGTRESAESALIREKSDFDQQVKAILAVSEHSAQEKYLSIIRLLADVAQKAKAGNCQEMAAVAFLFLMEQGIAPIEMVCVPTHTFVVIGRDPELDIDDPGCWNQETVICDPWRRGDYLTMNAFFKKESMIYPPQELLDCGHKYLHVGLGIYKPVINSSPRAS